MRNTDSSIEIEAENNCLYCGELCINAFCDNECKKAEFND